MSERNWKKRQVRQLLIGLSVTTILTVLNYFNNKLEVVYVPTAILVIGGIVATFIWIVKTAPIVPATVLES